MTNHLLPSLLKIAAIHMSVLLVPGQNFILVAMYTLDYSLRAGLWVGIGATIGMALYTVASMFGISTLIKEFPWIYLFIKYAGAAYLVYIGVMSFRKKALTLKEVEGNKEHPEVREAVRVGTISTLLNPRAAIYLVGLFSQVIDPLESLYLAGIYGCEVVLLTGLWFSFVAFAFSKSFVKDAFLKQQALVQRVFSILLIAFGIYMADSQ